MGKLWIKSVSASRDDGTTSTVDFINGLNCIVGSSNTGKTRIAKTIAFTCGGDETPFTEQTGYTTAAVTFVTQDGEVTLTRSMKPGSGIELSTTDPNFEPGRYSLTNDTKRPINAVLLQMLGFEANRKAIRNEAYKQIAFTWDSIKQILFVPESEIGREEPSILLPRKTTVMSLTAALSSLLVLTQDTNFDDVDQSESAAERSQRKKIIERFVYSQLDAIQPRIAELEKAEEEARKQGRTPEDYLSELQRALEQLEKKREEVLSRDADVLDTITSARQEARQYEVAIRQRSMLLTQYDADLSRLDLQVQALQHDHDTPHPDTCQFCHSPIEYQPPSKEEIRSRMAEMTRIQALRAGAQDDLDTIVARKEENDRVLINATQLHSQNMKELKQKVTPALHTLETKIHQLSGAEQTRAELKQLQIIHRRFDDVLEGKDEPRPRADKFKPREAFHHDFYFGMTKNIQAILKCANFPNAEKAQFDKEHFDITIAGYTKQEEQGKGYSAYLNTVVILAFHQYMNRRSAHAPGFLIVDTPLHGFDEGNLKEHEASMRAGLFQVFEQQAEKQQLIIIENTDHLSGISFGRNVNLIEFSKSRNQGRYGYLADVYDIAEEASDG